MSKCAVCGKTSNLMSMGGTLICRDCEPDIRDEMERLRAEGKQVSVSRIARDKRNENSANYLIRDIPNDLWRQVKSKAAMEGITIREMILAALRERTNTQLTGWEAVGYARARGLMLSKLADPTEGERIDDISPDEAEEMLRNDLPPEDLYVYTNQ